MTTNNNLKYLINKLVEADILTAKTYDGQRQVVHYWIRSGKLKLRQMPHSGYYIINEDEAKQIVKEFNVGGMGCWSYKPN